MTEHSAALPHCRCGCLVSETRFDWKPEEPIPDGWRSGNTALIEDYLDVFFYDPEVPYRERKDDGSTDRWIKHRKVIRRRYVTNWEVVND